MSKLLKLKLMKQKVGTTAVESIVEAKVEPIVETKVEPIVEAKVEPMVTPLVEQKVKPNNIVINWSLYNKGQQNELDHANIKHIINMDEQLYVHMDKLSRLESLELNDDFNYTFDLSKLNKLTEIKFGKYFNQVLTEDKLPPNLIKLTFGLNYMRKLTNLPASLEELYIDTRFNNILSLPANLKILRLGDCFEQQLILPSKLEELYLGYHFNNALVLPNTLKKLELSQRFNKDLILPDGLEELKLGVGFNKKLVLPKSLRLLKIKDMDTLKCLNINKDIKIIVY